MVFGTYDKLQLFFLTVIVMVTLAPGVRYDSFEDMFSSGKKDWVNHAKVASEFHFETNVVLTDMKDKQDLFNMYMESYKKQGMEPWDTDVEALSEKTPCADVIRNKTDNAIVAFYSWQKQPNCNKIYKVASDGGDKSVVALFHFLNERIRGRKPFVLECQGAVLHIEQKYFGAELLNCAACQSTKACQCAAEVQLIQTIVQWPQEVSMVTFKDAITYQRDGADGLVTESLVMNPDVSIYQERMERTDEFNQCS